MAHIGQHTEDGYWFGHTKKFLVFGFRTMMRLMAHFGAYYEEIRILLI